MLLVLQIAQYEAVALEVKKLLLVLFWTVFRIMLPNLPPEVVEKLSRDQKLAYLYSHAVQSGVMPDSLVNQTIGPLVKSHWLTCGVRVLCLYARTKMPSKGLDRLVKVLLSLYFPGWFRFRHHSHIQDGSRNYFYLLDLSHVP